MIGKKGNKKVSHYWTVTTFWLNSLFNPLSKFNILHIQAIKAKELSQ